MRDIDPNSLARASHPPGGRGRWHQHSSYHAGVHNRLDINTRRCLASKLNRMWVEGGERIGNGREEEREGVKRGEGLKPEEERKR